MKTFLVIAMLIIMASTQTTITPKTQACVCSNLLNLVDCNALPGCQWTPANSTNSTNTTTTTLTGTCANASTNTTTVLIPTFCGSITNGTLCAGQVGCAYLNNTCQIFTGCTAYVKTTHSDCQLISTQCTTDGTRCILPAACNTYTTQAVCVGSQGSTTKNCKWTPAAGSTTTGTCSDTVCTDAPTTLTTLAQCQAYISTCSSTGKGCVATLASCTTYLTTDGCSTRIGLEGKCIETTPASANCRAQVCTDATSASATSCTSFLSSSTCIFSGKGCVASPLPACNTYLIAQTCDSMIGSDGKCTTDKSSTTNCKLYTCADAPTSTVTDSDCSKINTSCVTNGQGCVTSPLPQCSTYTGSASTPCTSFKGLNGICKASATATCTDRTCTDDAAKTFTTDAQCDNYFKGCVTKGVGCVTSRSTCENYSGTADECGKFIGTTGNCTFSTAGQAAGTACKTKACNDAASTLKTNAECAAYSFQCASNSGTGCIEPGSCNTLIKKELCQGKSTCSLNQICYDRSSCASYGSQTLCLLNTQQYLPLPGTTYYERPCTWGGSACTDQTCPTTATLKTDADCQTQLPGCLTKGAGCIDISADCSQYSGLTAACEKFKGVNQTIQCTQDSTVNSDTTACIVKNCVNANKFNGTQLAATNVCSSFQGCYFDGKNNCTNSGCSTYFGIQDTCKNVANAVDGSSKKQYCWNTSEASSTTQCTIRACTDAPPTSIDDSTCNTFLPGCVTNGKGCVDPQITQCTNYVGGTIDTCQKFFYNGQQCTGTGNGTTSICIPRTCQDTVDNASATNCSNYLSTCQFDGAGCVASNQCSNYNANGLNDDAKGPNCRALKDSSGTFCGFQAGASKCSTRSCTDHGFTKTADSDCKNYLSSCYLSATATCAATKTAACTFYAAGSGDAQAKATLCQKLLDNNGASCGYKSGDSCSARSCTDVLTAADDNACKAYMDTCYFTGQNKCSETKTAGCDTYTPYVPVVERRLLTASNNDKAISCNQQLDSSRHVCGYQADAAKCSAKSCTDVLTATKDADCKNYLDSCYYNFTTSKCAATKTDTCNNYTPTSGTLDSEKAIICSYQIDKTTGKACGFQALATKCSNKSCTDVLTAINDADCKAYLDSCYYTDANKCAATKTAACDTYSAGAGSAAAKATFCQTLLDNNAAPCGYKSGNNCSARSCTDVGITNDTNENCKKYLSTCYLSATTTCSPVGTGACDTYTATGDDYQTKATSCNSQIDTTGKACGYQAGASKCSPKVCSDVSTANNNDTCNAYLSSCKSNANWNCKAKVCTDAPNTLKTDADCAAFRKGCVTNGGGCLDSAIHNCADYKGDRAACQKFVGKDGPCSNISDALTTSSCAIRQCTDNNNETSQAACDLWYPPLTDGTKKCIWNGTAGCIALATCDAINGTIDTCALVQASDKPCSGTATTLPSTTKCVSNRTICNKAPTSYTTDAQCKTWHKDCLSTGFGCVSDSDDFCKNIVNPTLCSSYKKDQKCELANQCLTKLASCSDLKSAFECNNTILTGTTVTCGWNAAAATPACISLTCELLPVTLTTDSACSTALTLPNITCTTNGAGCLTKTTCSGYTYATACNTASTTDLKKCIWSSSVCRNIVCTDNTTAKSDTECDTYLKGCRTIGTGCSSSFECTAFSTAALCQKDSAGNPCLWYKTSATATASCLKYTQCTDILQTTHAACQSASPLCTTDGTKCIAITGCAKTTSQVSCVVGTDGACGYLPASGTTAATCAPYTNCAAATGGTSFAACQAWGSTCVSNGTSCISQTACTGYLTEAACGNLGTSGTSTQKCIYSSGACRPQLCTDATATTVTGIATHNGCLAFPATTPCTTNGTNGCIAQSTCSSYSQTLSAVCVQGTDGPCFFQTTTTAATATTPASTTTACRLKQCSDILGTTSASCSTAIIGIGSKCVSNGVNCIAQSTCSTYTAREACLGGGSDGACAFTPGTNTTTPNLGTCQLFTACNQANQDQTACSLKSASCYFTPAPTNGTSSCTAHNCTTKASGSTCQAVPNFDLSQYQICVLAVGTTTCQPGTPAAFPQSSCYTATLSTYTWNPTSGQCQSCQAVTTPNNTNTTNNTNNTYGYLVSLLVTIAFMI